ncbi:unnamed protein product, partial [Meganyctiphanes norvegica]
MNLAISSDAKKRLGELVRHSGPVAGSLNRTQIQFIKKLVAILYYEGAIQGLVSTSNSVEDAVRGLIFLFMEGIQTSTPSENFQLMINKCGFSSEASLIILKVFEENREEFQQYLTKMGVQLPRYQDLEWRFDILVGSRTLHHIAEPLMTLQLSLDNTNSLGNENIKKVPKKLLLQTDPNNLIHMTKVLEEALQESHNHHFRRITRHIK